MTKNRNPYNLNELGLKQKNIYLLDVIVFFIIITIRENLISLFKILRNKRSIKYINRLIKIINSPAQIGFLKNDYFDEIKIKANKNINLEIINLCNQIFNIDKIESIIYELITLPKFGSLLKCILKISHFNKLNSSIYNIADCHLKLGEIFFENNLYSLSVRHLREASQIFKDNFHIYHLIGSCLSLEAKNIVNSKFRYDFVLNIVKFLKYIEALSYLKKALKLKPKDEKILLEIGNIYYDLENLN